MASFGAAAVWQQARDLLTQRQIVSRMDTDPAVTRADEQRMDLLVMSSEFEWARDILARGIPELGAARAFPPGGFPVVTTDRPPPLPEGYLRQHGVTPAAGAKAPMAALPVGPLHIADTPGKSAAYTIALVLLFGFMILLIISIVVVCFIPYTY